MEKYIDGCVHTSSNSIEQQKITITKDNILFFDLDGTLVDTDYANFLAYKHAIKSVINLDIDYNSVGRLTRAKLEKLFPSITETDLVLIIDKKEKSQDEFLPETKLYCEVVNILCKYSITNRTVLVTNCRENRALSTLNYHGLTDKFSDFFFKQPKEINKFQNAVSKLDISPKLVIAFENEIEEISNAQKVGIEIINPQIL